jgi:diguanylate cyclase (GGDEF)-like protein
MRKERLSYRDLVRRLLAGRLLRIQERRDAEDLLALPDEFEVAVRLGALLERVAGRGGLVRLGRQPGDRPTAHRYLDPVTADRWVVDFPGPRPVEPPRAAPPAAPETPPPASSPVAAEPGPEPEPEPAPTPAPAPPPAPEPPRIVRPVDELSLEPALARRFLDDETGEPLASLFTTFAPCRTAEEIGDSLGPVRDQVRARTTASDVRFHVRLAAEDEVRPIPLHGQGPGEHLRLGERVDDAVLGRRRALHVPNLGAPGTGARPEDFGALVTLPLVAGDRVAGLMEVHRDLPGAFEPDELRFFALAATVAASIVVRAEVLEKLIFIDKLTGLWNRAYFDDQIEREIERANRMGTSVALLMADLDHFKKINDNFGHQAGDLALAHLASIIRNNIRTIDVAARYGGEEFAVLLPSINRARAVRTAERLRRVVADTKFGEVVPGLETARLSISLGVALYPDDAATVKQLIDRADRVALYAAKNRGRNRVVSWSEARDLNLRMRPPTSESPTGRAS